MSVVMPVCNAEATVDSAVRSILRQTLADFELVIVDDGSTDTTADLVRSLAAEDNRIGLILTPHKGIIHALNVGVAACETDLVARMDADDISHPRRLQMQTRLMENQPEVSVCSSLVRMFPRRSLLGGLVVYEQWLNSLRSHEEMARDIFVESPMAHPSVMFRRSEFIEIGGYQDRGWAEDYDLWLRYHAAGKRFAKVAETLLFWRQAEGRLTFADPRYCLENFLRAKAHYLAGLLRARGQPVVLWGAGKMGRRLSKHLTREGIGIEAVIDIDPKKIGHAMRGAPIVGTQYLDEHAGRFVVAAVGSRGARELIRDQLRARGLVEHGSFGCKQPKQPGFLCAA